MTDSGGWDDWSEEDVRIRPNPRGTRPRTKVRPTHEDAIPGFVMAVDRGRYRVVTTTGTDEAPAMPGGPFITATRAGLSGSGSR